MSDVAKAQWRKTEANLTERDVDGGCVLLVGLGDDVSIHGYGYSDRRTGAPFGADTVFCVGSITKQFTAAAIIKAQEMGALRVDDPAAEYIPQFGDHLRRVTLHHLLTHSAGLEANYGVSDWEPVSRDELIDRIAGSSPRTPPGVQHHYSNAGYSMLAAILEIVFGRSYEEVLATELLHPAGLFETGYVLPTWERGRVAHNYSNHVDLGPKLGRAYDVDGPFWNLRGNGGIHSTAPDLRRWHVALMEGCVLSTESMELMFTPHVAEDESGSSHYGYGWAITPTSRGTRLIWHNGGDGVLTADFRRYIDEDVVLIAAANDVAIEAWELTQDAADHIFSRA